MRHQRPAVSPVPAPRGHSQLFERERRLVFPLEGHTTGQTVLIGQAVQDGPPLLFLGQCRVPQEGSVRGAVLFREIKSLGDCGERLPNDLRRRGDVVRCKLRDGMHGSSHNNDWNTSALR